MGDSPRIKRKWPALHRFSHAARVLGEGARQLQYGAVSDLYRAGYLEEQDMPGGGHFDGAPESLFTGNPPTLLPELLDDDGYSLDDTDIPESEQQGIIDAWNEFQDREAWNAALEETYTSNFYDQVAKG